ncbi:MAG: hypothetical protein JSS84_02525 [Bacteroidetes bacterium]|nr:hypothetical protein [Bacteroidota bacterium]
MRFLLMVVAGCLAQATMAGYRELPAEGNPLPGDYPASGVFIGAGVGLDHGGIGLRMDILASERIGIFAGGGYNLATVGWNAGLLYRHPVKWLARPYITGMYGYNLAIKWQIPGGGGTGTNYYGPSFGGGLEFWSAARTSFWHTALLVPVRSSEADEDLRWASPKPWPVLFSFGYHF